MRSAQHIEAPCRVVWWFAALAFALESTSHASPPLDRVLSCRSIVDPQARLACFDREAATLAAASAKSATPPSVGAVTAPASASAPAPAPASSVAGSMVGGSTLGGAPGAASADPTKDFGLAAGAIVAKQVAAGQRPADLTRIHAHVTELSRAGDGRLVLTLDNGQIWLQVLEEGDLLLRPGDAVSIARGVFHSFTLQTPSGRGCKVTRIR